MQSFQAQSRTDRGSAFMSIVDLLYYGAGGGEFLYEQLEDGHWAFRCDELTRLYALAAYRYAVVLSDYHEDQEGTLDEAKHNFCLALQSRPDVVVCRGELAKSRMHSSQKI
jgi:hypothetical protein